MEKLRDWINYNRIVHGSAIPPAAQMVLIAMMVGVFVWLYLTSRTFAVAIVVIATLGMPLGLWLNRKRK